MKTFSPELRILATASAEADRASYLAYQALNASTLGADDYPDLFIAHKIAFEEACKAGRAFRAALELYIAEQRK